MAKKILLPVYNDVLSLLGPAVGGGVGRAIAEKQAREAIKAITDIEDIAVNYFCQALIFVVVLNEAERL